MPWSLARRDGKWCVVKDSDGEVEGCHDSRTDAIKQQRALYANERRVAAIYDELDAREEEVEPVRVNDIKSPLAAEVDTTKGSELVKVVVGNEQDRALTASVVQSMDAISERLARADEFNAAVVAALQQLGATPPVVNVPAPQIDVNVPPAEVKVEPQITVEAPQVTVEAAPVPEVTVNPNIMLPPVTKTVTFERDPLTREVTSAEVTEA